MAPWKKWLGLARSAVIYWRPGRQRGLRRLYREFVRPGDLVFDIGAHLGDRSVAFASLGARVVAVEPQPHVATWLRKMTGRHRGIIVRPEAVGSTGGSAELAMSLGTPTVSTLSDGWRAHIPHSNPSFRRVRWEEVTEVPVTTLDSLIDDYGLPEFCKIDVEGHEAEVLAGLSHPVPRVSVEFVSGSLDVAAACVRRLDGLGSYEFNAVLGEQRHLVFGQWLTATEMLEWLKTDVGGVSSGDIYAQQRTG